jgi:Raf kinase inhibitor-like YbhB/YbcL family protein
MKLTSQSFRDGGAIPGRCAFAVIDPKDHVRLSANRNPELSWSGAPAGTQGFALLCVDPDAPSVGTDVNQEGRSVKKSLARAEFMHWALVDLAPSVTRIEEGACSEGVMPHGKPAPKGPAGSRQGVNDYTGWFANDPDMAGTYRGYDGPCPPWNDMLVHHYQFTLYALSVERAAVEGDFTAPQVLDAIKRHVLAEATLVGTYSLNPGVK